MKTMRPSRRLMVFGVCAGLVASAAGCASSGTGKDPRQLAYLAQPITEENAQMKVLVADFVVDPKASPAEVRYSVLMQFAQRYDRPLYLRVDFDDPSHLEQRIRKILTLPPQSEYFTIDSDPVQGMRYKWNYWVTVGLYNDPDGDDAVSTLTQRIRSNVDWDRLLTEGPDAFPMAHDVKYDEDVALKQEPKGYSAY